MNSTLNCHELVHTKKYLLWRYRLKMVRVCDLDHQRIWVLLLLLCFWFLLLLLFWGGCFVLFSVLFRLFGKFYHLRKICYLHFSQNVKHDLIFGNVELLLKIILLSDHWFWYLYFSRHSTKWYFLELFFFFFLSIQRLTVNVAENFVSCP